MISLFSDVRKKLETFRQNVREVSKATGDFCELFSVFVTVSSRV